MYYEGFIYERVKNKERLLAVSSMVSPAAVVCAPFTGTFYGYIACHVVIGMAAGFVDCCKCNETKSWEKFFSGL